VSALPVLVSFFRMLINLKFPYNFERDETTPLFKKNIFIISKRPDIPVLPIKENYIIDKKGKPISVIIAKKDYYKP
jgi:hypothetical protein